MSDVSNIETQVGEIVGKYAKLEPKDISRDTDLQTLNIESLDLIEIIFEVEDKFEIDIEQDEKAASLSTYGEVIDWLTACIGAQKAP
ncbi:MAG: acyl carrier protein [Alphaproteobacteria bacterium]